MSKHNLNMKFGKGDQVIHEWLELQKNKSWSVKFLIKQAIHRYGMTDVQATLEETTLMQPQGSRKATVPSKQTGSDDDVKKVAESFTF